MITNSNKAKTAGGGYNDLFVMQIPLLSSLPKKKQTQTDDNLWRGSAEEGRQFGF